MLNRRQFLRQLGMWGVALAGVPAAPRMGRKPPPTPTPTPQAQIIIPDFAQPFVSAADIDYLQRTYSRLLTDYAPLFPVLQGLPPLVVINTLPATLQAHANVVLVPEHVGDEALTLAQAQQLLVSTRFGSVATPHRGADTARFGAVIYVKQHPRTGYRTPDYLLLEELLHVQQDITVMRALIERDNLPPADSLHAQLKGISELGAHYYVDTLRGEPDYVFMLADGQLIEDAVLCVQRLAAEVNTSEQDLINALMYDTAAHLAIDEALRAADTPPLWQRVSTWRYARDAENNPVGLAPAFIRF